LGALKLQELQLLSYTVSDAVISTVVATWWDEGIDNQFDFRQGSLGKRAPEFATWETFDFGPGFAFPYSAKLRFKRKTKEKETKQTKRTISTVSVPDQSLSMTEQTWV
jgi:hypothetical protein